MMPVRALSWKQPYASMMLYGKAETRVWSTDYNGLVLICTALKPFNELEIAGISGTNQRNRMLDKLGGVLICKALQGKAIAIGRLKSCKPMVDYAPKSNIEQVKEVEDLTYCRFFLDLYVWEFKDVRPIKPIPWKGHQKWRTISKEEKERIVLL